MAAPGEWDGEEPVAGFRFRLMSQADAEAIARWQYPAPFSFYDWTSDPDDLAELLDPTARGDDYVAVEDEARSLIGFFHYKRPHGARLEIGLGLHPDGQDKVSVRAFSRQGSSTRAAASRPRSSRSPSPASTAGRSPCTSGLASLASESPRTGRTVASGSSSKCVAQRSEGGFIARSDRALGFGRRERTNRKRPFAGISEPSRTGAERPSRIDKLGLTGSSPVPPTF
jgi:hypothetical protein